MAYEWYKTYSNNMIATCYLVSTKFVYKSAICTKQFFYNPKFQDYSKQKNKKKIRDLNFQSLWMFQKMIKDLSKLETLTSLKSSNASNGVSLNNKKWLVIVSHVFKNWLTRNMSFIGKIRKEIKRKQRDNLKKW